MSEIINVEPFEFKQNELLLECLKNIIICLYNEKGEEIRKIICSNNWEEVLSELLKSTIDSTFLQIHFDKYVKEFSFKEMKYFSAQKTKILEKIIKMAVYFKEDQILFLYQFCKVIMGKGAFENSRPINLNENLLIEKNVQNINKKGQINQDINLSLNSNSHSENLNNSDLNIEEKEFHQDRIPIDLKESMKKEKICKRKRNEVLSQVSFGGSIGISDKTTIASSEKNNCNCIENIILSGEFNKDFKSNKEYIPSFLKKHSGTNPNFNYNNNSNNNSNNNKICIDNNNCSKFSFLGKTENFKLNNNNNSCSNTTLGNSKINGFFEKKKSGNNDRPIQVNDTNYFNGFNNLNEIDNCIGVTQENISKRIICGDQNLSVNNLCNMENKNSFIKSNDPRDLNSETNFNNLNSIKQNMMKLNTFDNSPNYSNTNENTDSNKDILKKCNNDISIINPNLSNYELIIAKNPNIPNFKKNTTLKSNSISNTKNKVNDYVTNLPNNKNSYSLLFDSKNKLPLTEYGEYTNTKFIKGNYLNETDIKKFNSWNNTSKIEGLLTNDIIIKNRNSEETNNIYHEYSNFNTVNGLNNNNEKRFIVPQQRSYNNLPISLKALENKASSEKFDSIEVENKKLKIENNKNLESNNNNFINRSNNIHLNLLRTKQDSVNTQENLNKYTDISVDTNEDFSNLRKNIDEEYSDSESNFALESKFITNNKKIILSDRIKASGKANIKGIGVESNVNSELIKNQYKIYNDDNNDIYYTNNLLHNNSKKINRGNKNLQSTNINDCNNLINNLNNNEHYKLNNNSFEKEKNQKLNESFNSAMSCEFIGNIPANIIQSQKHRINSECISNDILKKFNTSDAVKPPKIYLEINELLTNSNIDPMLIVNAEIDNTKKLIINKRNSYTSSIHRSNRSTSNDSKEFSNSNINMNNYNSKEGNINFSTNPNNLYNKDNSGQNFTGLKIKTNPQTKEKEQINSENIDYLSNKNNDKSQTNKFNSINYKPNNGDLNIKKKQNQKNQIFFPTEINIFNLNKEAK